MERAIRERAPRLAGPLALKQEGLGLIYRIPVFIGAAGDYWGVLSMVIDVDSLFAGIGIAPQTRRLAIALRGKDGMRRSTTREIRGHTNADLRNRRPDHSDATRGETGSSE